MLSFFASLDYLKATLGVGVEVVTVVVYYYILLGLRTGERILFLGSNLLLLKAFFKKSRDLGLGKGEVSAFGVAVDAFVLAEIGEAYPLLPWFRSETDIENPS